MRFVENVFKANGSSLSSVTSDGTTASASAAEQPAAQHNSDAASELFGLNESVDYPA